MKTVFIVLFVFCYTSRFAVFSQTQFESNILDKEKLEIAHIVGCIKSNKNADSLIEWKFSSKYDDNIVYKYKWGRLGFFLMAKNSKGLFLKSIVYYRRSFQKEIFLNDTLNKYEVGNQTRFRVWMSKDRPSIYFCMINQDNVMIWVFTNGNSVYTVQHKISEQSGAP